VSVRVVAAVEAALRSHSGVLGIRLVGSRAEGRAHDLSDWDLAVATDDFVSVSRDLVLVLCRVRVFG